jgi:hypothetical protein
MMAREVGNARVEPKGKRTSQDQAGTCEVSQSREPEGNLGGKPAHKKAAKRTAPSKAKSKIRSPSKRATRPAANKNLVPKTAARKEPRQVVEVPVEITTIDVIEEPVPGVVVVTEYESVQTATPVSPDTDTSPDTKK